MEGAIVQEKYQYIDRALKAHRHVLEAEIRIHDTRAIRDHAVWSALQEGATVSEIARTLDLTRQAVMKMRDGHQSKLDTEHE